MCKRCDANSQGYNSVLDVRDALGMPVTDPLWGRVLWPEDPTAYPRYLVEKTGRIVAIQEPGCRLWHIRTTDDDSDVNDSFLPVTGEYDQCLEDKCDAFNFDIANRDWS